MEFPSTIIRSLLALVANSIATLLRPINQTHPLLCRAGHHRLRRRFCLVRLFLSRLSLFRP